MSQSARIFAAAFNIFLLLSVHPIDARRTLEVKHAIERTQALQAVVPDLEAAIREDQQEEDEKEGDLDADMMGRCCCEHDGEGGTTLGCSVLHPPSADANAHQLQSEHLRQPIYMSANWMNDNPWVCPGHAHEKTGIHIGQAITEDDMSQRGMSLAVCQELKDSFETQATEIDAVYKTTGDFEWASKLVLRTRGLTQTLKTARKKQCHWVSDKSVDMSAVRNVAKVASVANPCFDEAKRNLEASMLLGIQQQNQALANTMEMLMSGTCDGTATGGTAGALLQHRAQNAIQRKYVNSQNASLEPTEFGEIIARMVGFVFIAIFWVLFCWVFSAIFLGLLGLILCTLKAMLVGLVAVMSVADVGPNWGRCMHWWMGVLGQSPGANSVGIGICAADALTGMIA